jgi:hypothetical protein
MQTSSTIRHGKLEDWNNGMMDFRNILIDGLVKSCHSRENGNP